jgi:hypothetical protein
MQYYNKFYKLNHAGALRSLQKATAIEEVSQEAKERQYEVKRGTLLNWHEIYGTWNNRLNKRR